MDQAAQASCTCSCHQPSFLETRKPLAGETGLPSISAIDQQITALEVRIAELKTLRNKHCPSVSLPSELLAEVFQELAQPKEDFTPAPWKDLLQLTEVCKSWRETALECAGLWSCVPILEPQVPLREMLARSKQHPFSLRYNQHRYWLSSSGRRSDAHSYELLDLLDASRLNDLHLAGFSNWMQPYVERFLAQELPGLRSLRCLVLGSDVPLQIPPQLFHAPKPSLRYLQLDKSYIDWNAAMQCTTLPISNLIMLSLDGLKTLPPFNLLTALLASSPQLEHLELAWTLLSEDSKVSRGTDVDADRAKIPLQHLRFLRVVDGLPLISNLLTRIQLPSPLELDIETKPRRSRDTSNLSLEETRTQLKTTLDACHLTSESHTHVSPPLLFHGLKLEGCHVSLDFHLTSALHHSLPLHSRRIPFADISDILIALDRKDFALTSTMLEDIFAPGLVNVSIDFLEQVAESYGWDSTQWKSCWTCFFQRHPTIKNLSITQSPFEDILDVLVRSDGHEPTFIPLLPSLESLTFDSVIFGDESDNQTGNHGYESLETFLADRAEAVRSGLIPTLPQVTVKPCWGFTREMFKSLKRLVPEDEECVIWSDSDDEGSDD